MLSIFRVFCHKHTTHNRQRKTHIIHAHKHAPHTHNCMVGGLEIDENSAVLGWDSCWNAWVFGRVAGAACAKCMPGDRAKSGETLVEAGSDIDVQSAPLVARSGGHSALSVVRNVSQVQPSLVLCFRWMKRLPRKLTGQTSRPKLV